MNEVRLSSSLQMKIKMTFFVGLLHLDDILYSDQFIHHMTRYKQLLQAQQPIKKLQDSFESNTGAGQTTQNGFHIYSHYLSHCNGRQPISNLIEYHYDTSTKQLQPHQIN